MSPAAPVPAPAAGLPGSVPATQILGVSRGTLFNDGKMVTVLATPDRLVLVPEGEAPRTEEIPGLRYALVGDYDGDGTQDLAVFTDSHVWIVRYSTIGSVAGGKASLAAVPENLSTTSLLYEGQTVLCSITAEKVSFYILHPARGLKEIGSVPVPSMAS